MALDLPRVLIPLSFLAYIQVGDFWSLDIATAWWSTIHVEMNQNFGSQGVASPVVFPGKKFAHSCGVTTNNMFFLFGGIYTGTHMAVTWFGC